jgi:TrmH family RNA methyltransferase
MQHAFKPYKKEATYSYSLGIFPTIELVRHQPQQVAMLIFSEDSAISSAATALQATCDTLAIPYIISDKQLRRFAKNTNVPVVGIYNKYQESLSANSHIVLVEPEIWAISALLCALCSALGTKTLP